MGVSSRNLATALRVARHSVAAATQRPLWLFHYTDDPASVLESGEIAPGTRFNFVGATERPDLWRFQGNERLGRDLAARIAIRSPVRFEPVEYAEGWFGTHPDEVAYITNDAWSRAGEMGAAEHVEPPEGDFDEGYDERVEQAVRDFVLGVFLDKSEEEEWVAEGSVPLGTDDIAWVDVRDPETEADLKGRFPQYADRIRLVRAEGPLRNAAVRRPHGSCRVSKPPEAISMRGKKASALLAGAARRILAAAGREFWRMTRREFMHPKFDVRALDRIAKGREGESAGVLGDYFRGEKLRALYAPVLDTPVMVIGGPIEDGKRVEMPEGYEFKGALGKFRGRMTIFLPSGTINGLINAMLEEGAHAMRESSGRESPKTSMEGFDWDTYEALPHEQSAAAMSEHALSLREKDHREFVEEALAAGEAVPAEVLADYPELAPDAAARTASSGLSALGEIGPDEQGADLGDALHEAAVAVGETAGAGLAGKPLILYHGTTKAGIDRLESGSGKYQRVAGIYLSKSRAEAEKYTKTDGVKHPGNVLTVRAYLRNPATREVLDELGYKLDGDQMQAELMRRGYDSVIDELMDEVVVFDPEQLVVVGSTPQEVMSGSLAKARIALAESWPRRVRGAWILEYIVQWHYPEFKDFDRIGESYELRDVPLAEIHSPRNTAEETVREYAGMGMRDMPPVVLDADMTIVDGTHRAAAAGRMGAETIPAYVEVATEAAQARGLSASSGSPSGGWSDRWDRDDLRGAGEGDGRARALFSHALDMPLRAAVFRYEGRTGVRAAALRRAARRVASAGTVAAYHTTRAGSAVVRDGFKKSTDVPGAGLGGGSMQGSVSFTTDWEVAKGIYDAFALMHSLVNAADPMEAVVRHFESLDPGVQGEMLKNLQGSFGTEAEATMRGWRFKYDAHNAMTGGELRERGFRPRDGASFEKGGETLYYGWYEPMEKEEKERAVYNYVNAYGFSDPSRYNPVFMGGDSKHFKGIPRGDIGIVTAELHLDPSMKMKHHGEPGEGYAVLPGESEYRVTDMSIIGRILDYDPDPGDEPRVQALEKSYHADMETEERVNRLLAALRRNRGALEGSGLSARQMMAELRNADDMDAVRRLAGSALKAIGMEGMDLTLKRVVRLRRLSEPSDAARKALEAMPTEVRRRVEESDSFVSVSEWWADRDEESYTRWVDRMYREGVNESSAEFEIDDWLGSKYHAKRFREELDSMARFVDGLDEGNLDNFAEVARALYEVVETDPYLRASAALRQASPTRGSTR